MLFIVVPALAEAPIDLELATLPGFSITGSQEWIRSLEGVSVRRIRIRSAKSGERPVVENIGSEQSPSYRVVGMLTPQDRLLLPGASFGRNDKSGIAAWLAKVKQGADPTQPAVRYAFGLSSEELVAVHEQLSAPFEGTTKGKPASTVARDIARTLPLEFDVDSSARPLLAERFEIIEEMSGMSSGTALAAALRPLGLVFAPKKSAGAVRLHIVPAQQAEESWPVGWPAEGSLRTSAPNLFKFLTVQFADVALLEAAGAIESRTEMPFLYDHNSLARAGINLEEMKVTLPESRTYYKKIIDRMFFQARLKAEVRLDESDRAFMWISPLKP